jgi:hypothetical protein
MMNEKINETLQVLNLEVRAVNLPEYRPGYFYASSREEIAHEIGHYLLVAPWRRYLKNYGLGDAQLRGAVSFHKTACIYTTRSRPRFSASTS